MSNTYTMKISRLTVDKLGVKLYDRVSAVIAELVSNSYDADATKVTVSAPMGEFLATKTGGVITSKNFTIEVVDDGIGMTPDEVNRHYLIVGQDRRAEGGRGEVSPLYKRKVMGRKGIGKLAPFGVCRYIEVITSGGEPITRTNEKGVEETGYLTAHIILDKEVLLAATEDDYEPMVGGLDNTLRSESGTTVRLSEFEKKKVPTIDVMNKQLSQRFGITSADWVVGLLDSTKTPEDENYSLTVGALQIEVMQNSRIEFITPATSDGLATVNNSGCCALLHNGHEHPVLNAGFEYEGKFYPIRGWMAYSREPYRDEYMAGVRIYSRKKIAAQTSVFNLKAGFTGEHNIRSYLVGELHAEWLDDKEDLILTDRRDIHWSHELGAAFEEWGQQVVKEIGKIARDPMREQTWQVFQEVGNLRVRINTTYPQSSQSTIRANAELIAKKLGSTIRPEEVRDPEVVSPLIDLSLMLAPHLTLEELLRDASDEEETPIAMLGSILKTARLAELSSFGRIAAKRLDVIERLEELKDNPNTDEDELQALIEEAPWLVNPQWAPITANKSLTTLRKELPKYFQEKHGLDISLTPFQKSRKRPDFVLSSHNRMLEIVEIKKPRHKLMNNEVERIGNYYSAFEAFLNDPAHAEVRKEFDNFHITLVCDETNISGLPEHAYKGMEQAGRLHRINWLDFFMRTENMHKEFLEEADRQRSLNPDEDGDE